MGPIIAHYRPPQLADDCEQARLCQSAPLPGQRAGASNLRMDICTLSGAASILVGQLLPAQSQTPLLQPCALCSSARKARR